ncbi:MAG: peroxiredoxin [Gammaproteobacteria bacterium]|nr:peroxiredoxin [Gammaproteobacteria bacterium]
MTKTTNMTKNPEFSLKKCSFNRLEWGKLLRLAIVCALGFSPVTGNAISYYRSFDGTGNNQIQNSLGSVGEHLLRGSPDAPDSTATAYIDDVDDPARSGAPGPREISNALSAQTQNMPNSRGLSAMAWYWGQWIDHDISLTEVGDTEYLPIQVPAGDLQFDPSSTGSKTIGFHRSSYDNLTGTGELNPRQQVNGITAWIDASNVYGSDADRALSLKELDDVTSKPTGRLKITSTPVGDLLPYNDNVVPLSNASLPPQDPATLFLAGDVRANEQAGLTAMHTLFMREHNRVADRIAATNSSLTGEEIYQQARKVVGAELQQITYYEFLPALLGTGALGLYTGYDEDVNPNISNVFSTAAFRVGHTMLNPVLLRLSDTGEIISNGNLPLRDAYFNPENIESIGIEPYLKGAAEMYTQEIDTHVVDDVRSFLFDDPGHGGLDLASLNIQRGRDHGLLDYNSLRELYGLTPIANLSDISSDPLIQMAFESLYGNVGVDSIDPWIGMLAEDHLMGAGVGELLSTIISDQFERLRDGDRFWFEQDPFFTEDNQDLLAEVRNTRFSDIILYNTTLTNLRGNVFLTGQVPEPNIFVLVMLGLLNLFVIETIRFFRAAK